MQQLMDTEEQDNVLKVFMEETYNSLTIAGSKDIIQQLAQKISE